MKKVRIFAVVMMVTLICGSAWAKKPVTPPPEPMCPAGLTGTWVGSAGDISWLAVHTSDSLDPTKGEMVMNWTHIDPGFIGSTSSKTTLTPGHGVWQLNDDGDYDYTWYAYLLDNDPENEIYDGAVIGIVRCNGVAMLHDPVDPTLYDCDMVAIKYHISFAVVDDSSLPFDLSAVGFGEDGFGINGWAGEKRVPLVPSTPAP